MSEISEIDWARLAMAIDTDGGITIIRRNNHTKNPPDYHLKLIFVNTDRRLPEWIKQTFGGNIGNGRQGKTNHKIRYDWELKGQKAYKILLKIKEYLVIKQERAETGILFWEKCTRWTKE